MGDIYIFRERFKKLVGNSTHEEVAERIGTSRQNVGNWLNGKSRPNIYELSKIAKYFNISADYLLGITEGKTPMAYLDKLQKILDHYGFEAQIEILVEECAELIQAVQKLKRYGYSDSCIEYYENFKEEVADVGVMVEQMILAIGENEVLRLMEDKVERQLRRIEDEN
jgi:transcriptional regulator with XRE-family HTH domain